MFLLICYFCTVGFLAAQAITIQGVVLDANNRQTLTGASITEKGTTNGSTSDKNGAFELQLIHEDAILIFSFIGYQSVELPAANNITISLHPDISILNEIVVTALNLERSSKGLGYAIQKLSPSEMSEVKSPNFIANRAGRVAGLSVNQGATGVGSSSKITIRGEASFTNNNPLFVVDGIPINNSTNFNFTNGAAAGFQEIDFGNG
ncbi:MAG TPA: SusC/RagA family TonB-linked outer membrane protein, partial [Saprospiraceae bacterium]|nr:SusC/RagA family TonB-linked outer membrane protein [Saprospiraceae bacterium]